MGAWFVYHVRELPAERWEGNEIDRGAIIVGLFVLAGILTLGWHFFLQMNQMSDTHLCRGVVRRIESYTEENGSPPTDLDVLHDGSRRNRWGNRYLYETDGSGWILVSYGLGGRPDGVDYWAFRERQVRESRREDYWNASVSAWPDHEDNICGHYFRDVIFTDLGQIQVCGK